MRKWAVYLKPFKVKWLSQRKALEGLFQLGTPRAPFFMEHHFYVRKWLAKHGSSDFVLGQTFSQKLMKWACHFICHLLPMMKFWVFKPKLEMLKICIWHVGHDCVLILRDGSGKMGGDINTCDFWHHVMICVHMWKNCITQWNNNFPKD